MKPQTIIVSIFFFLLSMTAAQADLPQVKLYKEAYPDAKPKCINCHTAAVPKKDGDHELNDYGKKVKATDEKPTAETYKKVGTYEEQK